MTAALTSILISFLVSFVVSGAFWLFLSVIFGIERNWLLLSAFLSVVILGLDLVFGIGDGLRHITVVGVTSVLNGIWTPFSFGAVLALLGIAAAIVAALWTIFAPIFED